MKNDLRDALTLDGSSLALYEARLRGDNWGAADRAGHRLQAIGMFFQALVYGVRGRAGEAKLMLEIAHTAARCGAGLELHYNGYLEDGVPCGHKHPTLPVECELTEHHRAHRAGAVMWGNREETGEWV